MPLALPALRLALAARLETVEPPSGQQRAQIFPRLKSQITPPTLMVAYPEEINYHHASMGESRWVMIIFGIGAAGIYDEAAQEMIDAWLADEGTSSVTVALEGDPSLGGIAEDVTVISSTGYQAYSAGGQEYLGTEWRVEILG